MSHMQSNNILSDMQLGFWKRRSAELQSLQIIHDLTYNLDQNSQMDMILLKALGKVSHRHLLLSTKLDYISPNWAYTECCLWWVHLHPL